MRRYAAGCQEGRPLLALPLAVPELRLLLLSIAWRPNFRMSINKRQSCAVLFGVFVVSVLVAKSLFEHLPRNLTLTSSIKAKPLVSDVGGEVGAPRSNGSDLEDGPCSYQLFAVYKTGTRQVGPGQVGPVQVGSGQVGPVQVGPGQVGPG